MEKLVVIYKDEPIKTNILALKNVSNIIEIEKLNTFFSFSDFKYKGNYLISTYNEIVFSSKISLIFFICASELTDSVISSLLDEKPTAADFYLFQKSKTEKLIRFLSGLAIKREVLIKTGAFDKHICNNLYLNFLINYCRFFNTVSKQTIAEMKMSFSAFNRYMYWDFFENIYYNEKVLYIEDYKLMHSYFDNEIKNNFFRKFFAFFINKYLKLKQKEIRKKIIDTTFIEYW